MRGRRGWERRLAERSAAVVAAAAPGRRIPDLSVLPPLLADSGAFSTLRERLSITGRGRHVGLTSVPHGAKTYLAAALSIVAGERICWIARDAEIGDRVAEELAAWVGDPSAVAVLEPRTALAYERSELVADETAARVAALSAWRSGRAAILVASVQALLQHTLRPEDLPAEPRTLRVGSRVGQAALMAELLELGYDPVLEVAGKGEVARRGGLVDVFPPSAGLPIRIELFGDEVESLRRFDPTDQRSVGRADEVVLLPASEFLLPSGGAELRERLAGALHAAGRLPERLAADLERMAGPAGSAPGADRTPSRAARTGSRAADVEDAAEVWAPLLAPATGLDHVAADAVLVLDEPGDVAEAAAFLWRQADERRDELVQAGELPRDWPATILGPRPWKARLLGARTLELTWESEVAREAAIAGGGTSSGDLFGWREPTLPPGRAQRIGEAVELWRGGQGGAATRVEAGPGRARAGSGEGTPHRIVITSDQAPRLAELLEEAGVATGVTDVLTEPPPPGAVALVDRSLNGGFEGGPDGLVFVTDRELFANVRVRRPKAMRRVVPRDILERLTP
ncbi:MAG TPA: hypothetical protein VJ506_11310, partial [Candidatus Limnocylindrales bacterium]|nr:hypothetical protein [Candidatus Limnocylindrales bacterium]